LTVTWAWAAIIEKRTAKEITTRFMANSSLKRQKGKKGNGQVVSCTSTP
jgi:hypothetical protein